MCDDLAATMAELRGRGAEFEGDVVEQRGAPPCSSSSPAPAR